MGKEPLKENTNVYFQARKRAAMSNDRLFSRENAAELLGISPYTLADYELGNTKVVPVDKVVLMADLYNAPELITGYCKYQCPIHGFMPLATEEKNLQGITLRLLNVYEPVSVHPEQSGGNSISVPVNVSVSPQFVIEGSGGKSEDDIMAIIRKNMKAMADELGGEIADRLEKVFSNMPTAKEA